MTSFFNKPRLTEVNKNLLETKNCKESGNTDVDEKFGIHGLNKTACMHEQSSQIE